MQPHGPPLVAVATGIVGSAWASGAIACFSLVSVPAVRTDPQSATANWADLYRRGANLMPKVGLAVALSYAYAAYDAHASGGNVTLGYAAAAASVVSIVPFTLLVMKGTNTALHKAAKDRVHSTDADVSRRLDTWTYLNLGRAFLPLAGAVIGVYTFLNSLE